MWYVCHVLYAVVYSRVNCFVVRGCTVSRRNIHVCNSHVFIVVNMYLHHLKFCVVCINVECMSVVVNVMLPLMSVMSPPCGLCNISVRMVVKLCTLGVIALGLSFVF